MKTPIEKRKRGRPRKSEPTLKEKGIYFHWRAWYEQRRRGDPDHGIARISDRKARGSANKFIAHQYALSDRQIQNIISGVDANARTREGTAQKSAARLSADALRFEQMYAVIEQAITALRERPYRDLLDDCAMETRFGPPLPKALQHFSSAEGATGADSLQRLASVLAQAFLTADEARRAAETKVAEIGAQQKKNQTRTIANEKFPAYSKAIRASETKSGRQR